MLATLRLMTHAIEGLQDSGAPVSQSQRLHATLSDSLAKLVEARSAMASAIGQLQVIHRRSNQAEVDVGCPTPWYPMGKIDGLPTEPETRAIQSAD